MARLILAFDEEDEIMGVFNRGCMEDFDDFLRDRGHTVTIINSNQLNDMSIQFRTNGQAPFIFAAYSHGQPKSLYSGSGEYISTTTNHNAFAQSFFYTVSCNSGKELGACLIENGCANYFGYESPFNFWDGYKSFSQCANIGFFHFLDGKNTSQVYEEMITEYNAHIDDLYLEDMVVASLLRQNRDALIRKGQDISIDDFQNK